MTKGFFDQFEPPPPSFLKKFAVGVGIGMVIALALTTVF